MRLYVDGVKDVAADDDVCRILGQYVNFA